MADGSLAKLPGGFLSHETAVKVKTSVGAAQTCSQMCLTHIAFPLRHQQSYVQALARDPLGWLESENSAWQNCLRGQPSASLHVTSQDHPPPRGGGEGWGGGEGAGKKQQSQPSSRLKRCCRCPCPGQQLDRQRLSRRRHSACFGPDSSPMLRQLHSVKPPKYMFFCKTSAASQILQHRSCFGKEMSSQTQPRLCCLSVLTSSTATFY